MTRLSLITTLVGLFIIGTRLPGVIVPGKVRDFALKFPRSVFWGRLLTGILAAFVWVIMYRAATDEWAWARPLIVAGIPIAYWLVIHYGTHFLALRGAAGLMLLVAKQILVAADWHESKWRLIMTVVAYLWVIGAIWMTVAPHHIRDLLGWFMANDQRCRRASTIGVGVGVALVLLGVFVY